MNSPIDFVVSSEAIYSTDVLVIAHEPATARSTHFAEGEKLQGRVNAIRGQSTLGAAIDCLRDDLISLYVSAEEIHWHLRVKQHETENCCASVHQTEVARQLSACLLQAIARSIRVKEMLSGQGHCDELWKALHALQAENKALMRE